MSDEEPVDLPSYWKENIRKNLKKISATLGQMIISGMAIIIVILKEHYDWGTAIILIAVSFQPFFNWWMNLIFKGESELLEQQIKLLTQQLVYERDVSEWKVRLAAIKLNGESAIRAASEWNECNERIGELEKKMDLLVKTLTPKVD